MDPFRISAKLMDQLREEGWLEKQLKEGKSLQEIVEFSDGTMQKFYEVAYHLFQAGKDQDAADAFLFLSTLNPAVHIFWVGLGMAEQCLQHYEEALSAYAMASLTEMEDPLPYYHSAACYHALQDNENCRKSIEMALHYFEGKPEYAALKETAELIYKASHDL